MNDKHVESYAEIKPLIDGLVGRLKPLLADIASEYKIDTHAIEVRAKEIKSFQDKIQRAGKSYVDPINELTDLCGARVIVYYQEDVDLFCDALSKEFEIDGVNSVNKRDELNYDQFGYISRHVVGRISKQRSLLVDWKKYSDIKIEIQVRTVLQHGWASISHALKYKSSSEMPAVLARQLTRVAGLLELADEQFSELRNKSTLLKSEILDSLEVKDYKIPSDFISIDEYSRTSAVAEEVERSAREVGFGIEPGAGRNQFVIVASKLNLHTIRDVDNALSSFILKSNEFFEAFARFEEEDFSGRESIKGSREHWCAVGIIAVTPNDTDVSFMVSDDLWGESYLSNVKRARKVFFNK